MLFRQEPEGIEGEIRRNVLGRWAGLEGGLIAEAGQEELGKDQDPGSIGQGRSSQK